MNSQATFEELYKHGQLAFQKRRYREAQKNLQAALTMNAGHASANNLCGLAYSHDPKRREEGERYFLRSIHLDCWNEVYRLNLSALYLSLGKLDQARIWLRGCQRLRSEHQAVRDTFVQFQNHRNHVKNFGASARTLRKAA